MLQRLKIYGPSWRDPDTHWNLLILIQEGLRFVHGGMRKCPGMMHTSALILFNQPVNKVKTCPGSAPFQALLPGPVMSGGVELCDHPCRTAARCGVKRAVNGCELRGPHRRPRVQTARRPRRPLCPGPLRPCEPLLIEVQPPVGASQRGPGKGSVQNNYYVTLVSFTTQDRGGVKYSTNVWKEVLPSS